MNHQSRAWKEEEGETSIPRETEQTNNKQTREKKRHQVEIINETHKYEPPIKFKRKQFYSDQSDFRLLGNYNGMPAYTEQKKKEISDDDA